MNQSNIISERYESINGLRVFAAIGILILHVYSNITIKPTDNFFTETIKVLFPGFTILFMTLSGFSMFCGYYTKFKENKISLNDFYIKRYKKTIPFFALLTLIDISITRSYESVFEGIANITLAFGLLPNAGDIQVIGVGWFLGVLFLFYMLFPFFVFLLWTKKRAWIVMFISVAFSVMCSYYFEIDRRNMIWSAPFFVLGGLIYLYINNIKNFIRRFPNKYLFFCIFLIFMYLYVYVIKKVEIGNFEVKMVIFCLWLFYAISIDSKFMHNKFIDYICSFRLEIYLSHMMIFRAIEMIHLEYYIKQCDILFITTLILTIIGTILFAHLTKRIIFPKTINKLLSI